MNLLEVKKEYGSTAKIPAEMVHAVSADGKTVVLVDGTKVSDEIIAAAVREADAAKKVGGAAAEDVVAMLAKLDDAALDRVAEIIATAQAARSAANAGETASKGRSRAQ